MISNVMHGADSSLKKVTTKTPRMKLKERVNELRSHFPGYLTISAKMPTEVAEANIAHSMIKYAMSPYPDLIKCILTKHRETNGELQVSNRTHLV